MTSTHKVWLHLLPHCVTIYQFLGSGRQLHQALCLSPWHCHTRKLQVHPVLFYPWIQTLEPDKLFLAWKCSWPSWATLLKKCEGLRGEWPTTRSIKMLDHQFIFENHQDLKLSDCLRYHMRDTNAAKDLLYRSADHDQDFVTQPFSILQTTEVFGQLREGQQGPWHGQS